MLIGLPFARREIQFNEKNKSGMTECVIANPTRRKFIITADPTQIDLPFQQQSGLKEATKYLQDIEGIGFVQLNEYDIIRHPLVTKIVEAYVKNEKQRD